MMSKLSTSRWKESEAIEILCQTSNPMEERTIAEEVNVPPELESAKPEAGLLPEKLYLAQQDGTGCKKKENITLFLSDNYGNACVDTPLQYCCQYDGDVY